MKLHLTPEQKVHAFAVCDQAKAAAKGDMMKEMAVDLFKRCIEEGEITDLDHALLDLASLMTTGKELPPLKGRRRSSRKTPERKYKRGTGSY